MKYNVAVCSSKITLVLGCDQKDCEVLAAIGIEIL